MGGLLSYLWSSPGGDVPDEKTTLTPNEKNAIRATWKVIYANKCENGVAFFIRIFTQLPEAKKLFKNLEGIDDLEKLAKHPRLKAHGLRVMAAVNSWIEYLDDSEVLIQLLVDIGISHAKHKIPEKYFEALGGIVIWLVETKSGSAYSDYAKNAWIKAWGVMKPIMVNSLIEASKSKE
ncbi:cytoglobin-like [Glandiceps talaboti]